MEVEDVGAGTEGQGEQGLGGEAAQGVEQQERSQPQEETQQQVTPAPQASAEDAYKAQFEERDKCIAELEAQVAEAAESKAAAKSLRAEIEKMRGQATEERLEFELMLAGARNVKACRALLADYDNDVSRLREAEPWLFQAASAAGRVGATGLEPAGAARGKDEELARWLEIAGVEGE